MYNATNTHLTRTAAIYNWLCSLYWWFLAVDLC